MSQRNLVILLLTAAVSYACYVRGEQNPYARHVANGLMAISDGSLEPVPSGELFDGAMRGMVDVLDRHGDEHSEFFSEQEADPLRSEIRQQFGGIGVRIRFAGEPRRLVIAVPPDAGTPAARANLRAGDHILAIDDVVIENLDFDHVLRLMRGEPGSVVRLTIQHAGEAAPRRLELVREIIEIESILGDERGPDGKWRFTLAAHPRIAHLRITMFGDRTAEEFIRIVDQSSAEGAQAIVLDLRDNPGGALDAAVAVCDLLLPAERTIVETRGRDGMLLRRYETSGLGRYLDLPLAVLVNQNSASAAEIVAACLQDHRRGAVVGQRTYGKGTVQQMLPLGNKSLLKLTWASFWRPSGVNLHRMRDAPKDANSGVMPDAGLELPLSQQEYAAYLKFRSQRDLGGTPTASESEPNGDDQFIDRQLVMAAEYLRGMLEQPGL
jgi:carboxyl-terminal processing protease